VSRPAQRLVGSRVPGQSHRLAARNGHNINVVVALVLRGEGNQTSVRGDLRETFLALVRREPQGDAAGDRHFPEVAFRREHDYAAADSWVAVKAVGQRIGATQGGD